MAIGIVRVMLMPMMTMPMMLVPMMLLPMVIVMFWLLRHLFRVQPAGDVWYLALKSKKSCVQKIFNARVGNLNDAGGGRQRLDAGAQAFHIGDALRAVGQIGLGQHDAIGDRNLLDRFFLRIERGLSVDRIHKGDDALKPETQHQIWMMHDRVQHRQPDDISIMSPSTFSTSR